MYAVQENSSKISFTYLNSNVFLEGQVVNFLESGVNGIASTLKQGSTLVTSNFQFSNGQTNTYYGYSYIQRKESIPAPTRKLKVVFTKGYYESSDTGDITNVNSYSGFN